MIQRSYIFYKYIADIYRSNLFVTPNNTNSYIFLENDVHHDIYQNSENIHCKCTRPVSECAVDNLGKLPISSILTNCQ